MNKKFKKFTYGFFALVAFISCFYVAFCFSLAYFGGKTVSLAHFYKTYLLESTKDKTGRIIIDSGSSGLHGISAAMIQNELNRTAINIADNMTIPLSAKFARLKANIQKGDVLVLPIEYHSLTKERELTDQFVAGVFFDFGVYWQFLSFTEKLEVISKIKLSVLTDIIKKTKRNYKNIALQKENQKYLKALANDEKIDFNASSDIMLVDYINKNILLSKGDFGSLTKPKELGAGEKRCALTCQECNIWFLGTSTISPEIIKFASYAQKIGAKVLFTYPNIAGKECYYKDAQMQKNFEDFISNLKKELAPYDALYIGDFLEASFDESYIFDSPHHIDDTARKLRTKRLLKHIKKYI